MTSFSEAPLELLTPARLVPLLQIDILEDAVPLARTFVEAGLPVMEIALRTKVAPEAIRIIRQEVPEAMPIAGNIMTAHDLSIARRAGAHMAVSPGSSDELLKAAAEQDLPFMPGIATPSELMHVISKGFHVVKFFPAAPFGGSATLRALAAPFPRARFYPTGGTSELDFADWIALENVMAVGGSWLAPVDEIRRRDWAHIGKRATYMVSQFMGRRTAA